MQNKLKVTEEKLTIKDTLEKYVPFNEQERKDKDLFLKALKTFPDVYLRKNEWVHFCSSAFILNKSRTKILCVHHNTFNSWIWPGGHSDGDKDMIYVAEKESREETSIGKIQLLSDVPISIDSIPAYGHFREGEFVCAHTHYVFCYAYEADEKQKIHIQEEENSKVAWIKLGDFEKLSNEPHIVRIFKKIVKKLGLKI